MSKIKPITAAGGVVYREGSQKIKPNILAIYRRGKWDLPKGKLEDGETIKECAVREVAEEVGLTTTPNIATKLHETYHEYEQAGTYFGKTTHWFAMQLNEEDQGGEFNAQEEEGIEEVKWFDLEKAKIMMGYANLVEVLDAFDQWQQ
ncbi:NUDIX domain-containing protein [Fodinibius salinus]|uniref:NUDIX domain-containing protein n=1 Tax=Fodinibius salinus TaxID=860790 RepID=A0A5D3YGW7_9BACT|nr:NUDIX hydrolase [Fodinibius salinus]TYP92527.1 NUDIX domain-containing protein [Fodinibius salinus]